MISTGATPLIYDLADAVEIDLRLDYSETVNGKLQGYRHAVMEVFEGYSPTVNTEVTDTIIDQPAGIIAICVRVWGNLNVICINDDRAKILSMFVYDRSKVVAKRTPWLDRWSRKHTYRFLGPCTKGIYWRSVFDTEWKKLSRGPSKLQAYNVMRVKGTDSTMAYMGMWGDK